MTTHINRQRATTRTRTAQALLGVLVIGGGAALAVGLKPGARADAPPSGKPAIPEVADSGAKTGAAKNRSMDTSGLAERLNLASNAPKPTDPPPVVAGQDKPAPQQPASDNFRYLGAVMGGRNMALISDNGKQRFVAVGDHFAGGTVESITETAVHIAGDVPRTLDLVTRAGDAITRGVVQRGNPLTLRPAQPGSLAVVKQPPAAGVALGAANGGGINGQQIPPIPEYIRPEQAGRYEELRSEIRGKKGFGSEAEVAEYAAKLLSSEDPKSVDLQLMEKERAAGGGSKVPGGAKGVKN